MTPFRTAPIKPDALRERVAVITGAASGIGLALALEAAAHGMAVALSDVGEEKLLAAKALVEARGVRVIAVRADVSKLEDVQMLHDRTVAELGDPWLVANNAGITKLALTWDHQMSDWRRMFDINVFGVVNGLQVFLPGLRKRDSGYILNTSSAAGLVTIPAAAAYVASKHAVVGLSETLYRELQATHSSVGLSVLCPALVRTAILGEKKGSDGQTVSNIDSSAALEPVDVARTTFRAMFARQFWILTHAHHMAPIVRARVSQMIDEHNPDADSIDADAARASTTVTGVSFV